MYSWQRASSLSVRVLTLLTGELTLLDGSPYVRDSGRRVLGWQLG